MLRWNPSPRISCREKGPECSHRVCHYCNASFQANPQIDSKIILLTILKLVASGSDNIGYDGKDAKTEKKFEFDFSTKVDLNAPKQ